MASTYSPLLRFELIGSGDQSGLWGTTTNGNLGTLVEQAVAGVASIVLSSTTNYTLQSLNGTADEARCAVLSFSGTTGGATNIIIPASQKLYVVRNATGSNLVIKTSAQVGGVTVGDANSTLVFCNGINALAGIQSSSLADVVGPGSSTDNAFTRFNGTTGKIIQNSTGATLDDAGAATFTGTVQVGPQSTTVGAVLKLLEGSTSGTNFVAFKAPNTISADVTWTLPSADATVSGQYLASNAAGTLSWVTPSAGSGTVTSVAVSGSNITVTGSPITSSGTISVSIPQAVATTSSVQFGSFGVGTAASGTTGEIRATNNVTAYYSDDRLKTRLGNIENALDKVKTLDAFYYEANQTAQDLGYEPVREVGISAQQVQAVMAETVAPAPIDDKYLTVRYERLVPLLIAAIKELEAKVAVLEAK